MQMSKTIVLDNGKFRAEIVPEIGGNIISLRHCASGTTLLREPSDLRELAEFPARFGLPVLFPPNRIRDGRNNITILAGDSEKLSEYETVFQATDEMGIVYYDIVNCSGDLYMIWSNSERFPDKIVRGVLQGKDTLYCSLLATKK